MDDQAIVAWLTLDDAELVRRIVVGDEHYATLARQILEYRRYKEARLTNRLIVLITALVFTLDVMKMLLDYHLGAFISWAMWIASMPWDRL